MCAVYALFGVVLIPVSFLAIRLSQHFIHPVVFTSHGPQMTGAQFLTFCVSLAAMLSLFATLYNVELAGKRVDAHVRELRRLLACSRPRSGSTSRRRTSWCSSRCCSV